MKDLALDERIFLGNELDCAIQEIDLLFNTTNCELLGDTGYGTDWEQFLWILTPTTSEIENYIKDKIGKYTYFAAKMAVEVNVQFQTGDYSCVYYVQITLTTSSGNSTSKTYKLQ